MRKEITANLVNFYLEIASGKGLSSGSFESVQFVMNDSWPNFILGGEGSEPAQLERIAKAILKDELPPVWIRESEPAEDFEQSALQKGIRKINYWIGMEKEMDEAYHIPEMDKGPVIEYIEQGEDLEEWLEIVNTVILTSNRIEYSLVRNLMQHENIHFFGLRREEMLVSTALIYVHSGIAGIYFVATRNEYMGKGYGTKILCEAMNYCFSKGISKFVLHSTQAGIHLYEKLGFVKNGEYDIYWMLGKR